MYSLLLIVPLPQAYCGRLDYWITSLFLRTVLACVPGLAFIWCFSWKPKSWILLPVIPENAKSHSDFKIPLSAHHSHASWSIQSCPVDSSESPNKASFWGTAVPLVLTEHGMVWLLSVITSIAILGQASVEAWIPRSTTSHQHISNSHNVSSQNNRQISVSWTWDEEDFSMYWSTLCCDTWEISSWFCCILVGTSQNADVLNCRLPSRSLNSQQWGHHLECLSEQSQLHIPKHTALESKTVTKNQTVGPLTQQTGEILSVRDSFCRFVMARHKNPDGKESASAENHMCAN